MYCAKVSIFKKSYEVRFCCFLQSFQPCTLTSVFSIVRLHNLLACALEGRLTDQQLWCLLVVPDLVQSCHSRSSPGRCPLRCLAPSRPVVLPSFLSSSGRLSLVFRILFRNGLSLFLFIVLFFFFIAAVCVNNVLAPCPPGLLMHLSHFGNRFSSYLAQRWDLAVVPWGWW